MSSTPYGYVKTLTGVGFEDAVTRVSQALQNEGFGVLTEIDIKGTLEKKLDVNFRKYKILGACNPVLAHRALESDPQIGLMLPCNVVVQESEGGDVVVSVARPKAMFEMVANASLESVAEEADGKLRRVIGALE